MKEYDRRIKKEDIHIISGKVLMENGIGLIKKGMQLQGGSLLMDIGIIQMNQEQ